MWHPPPFFSKATEGKNHSHSRTILKIRIYLRNLQIRHRYPFIHTIGRVSSANMAIQVSPETFGQLILTKGGKKDYGNPFPAKKTYPENVLFDISADRRFFYYDIGKSSVEWKNQDRNLYSIIK